MKKELDFLVLFDRFISETLSGKRLQKNGNRLRRETIKQYEIVRHDLANFSNEIQMPLRIRLANKLNKRELRSELNYWNKFYKRYTDFLYRKGCYDNYVGSQIKIIRSFFNYLNQEKGILTGNYHRNFYVTHDNIPVIVLSPLQLQFLIHNKEFENSLSQYLRQTKDTFVFGYTVALRVSDLMRLTKNNLERNGEKVYLKVRSKKTKKDTRVKLPEYALEILEKYKKNKFLLPRLSTARLNDNIKELCEKAGWIHEIDKVRTVRGISKRIYLNGKKYRFCDFVSSHTMRRTAVTTLLSMGVPEIMVRKVSGHAANSKEFYRYVEYAQHYIDQETDRAFSALMSHENGAEYAKSGHYSLITETA